MMQKYLGKSREVRRASMFRYVAKELLGRYLAREHKTKEKKFSWEKFAAKFEAEYKDYSAEKMLQEILDNCHWLTTEQAVIDLYYRYCEDASKRSGNGKNNNDDDFVDD